MKRFVLLLALWFLIGKFCAKQTDGFALTKLGGVFLEEEEKPVDSEFFSRPYYYLAKGGQSFVFVSEDGQYVLKFLRSSRHNALSFFAPFAKKALAKEEGKMRGTLKSFALAREKLCDEIGLVAAHLGQSEEKLQAHLVDKLGIVHTIDPMKFPFLIQKRATLVHEKIEQLMQTGDLKGVEKMLSALFFLVDRRISLGIEDGDPNLAKNFGFVGDEPIEIDGGRFFTTDRPSFAKIESSKEDLQHFVNKHYPELSELFDTSFKNWMKTHETL